MIRNPDEVACREFVELVTDYLEGALPEEVSAALEAHLAVCDGCTLYLGQMRLTIRALARQPNNGLPADLRERLLNQIRLKL
jgi:anti-sigma factor (TIGR02949 family)